MKFVFNRNFERAIAVKSADEQPVDIRLKVAISGCKVDAKYDGPRLDSDVITLEFVEALVERFRNQGTLHRKYAMKILLMIVEQLMTVPTLTDIPISPDGKITVCGDTHGQFYDLLVSGTSTFRALFKRLIIVYNREITFLCSFYSHSRLLFLLFNRIFFTSTAIPQSKTLICSTVTSLTVGVSRLR